MNNNSSAISSKIRAKFAKHLKKKNYEDLLSKNELSEVVNYLKDSTYYSKYIQIIGDAEIRRAQFERMLRDSLFTRYSELLKYVDKKTLGFYNYEIILSEIKGIIQYLRLLNNRDSALNLEMGSYQLGKYSKINFYGLMKATTYHQFMDGLLGTPYYPIFSRFVPLEGENINYSYIEIALNQHYHHEVNRLIEEYFKGKDAQEVREIFFTKIEIENLIRIYRLKKYFNTSPAQVKLAINPYYQRISKMKLDKMIDDLDADQFIKELNNTLYGKYLNENENNIEKMLKNILFDICRHYLSFSSNSAVVLMSYMELSQIEIENIIEIAETKRYHASTEKIKDLITY